MTITKRVRMSGEEATLLGDIAARDGKTESEVLREGILAYDRERARSEAWDELVAMAERDKDLEWTKSGGFK